MLPSGRMSGTRPMSEAGLNKSHFLMTTNRKTNVRPTGSGRTFTQDPPCVGSLKWPMLIAQTATQTIEMTCDEAKKAVNPVSANNKTCSHSCSHYSHYRPWK